MTMLNQIAIVVCCGVPLLLVSLVMAAALAASRADDANEEVAQ
jgi:hypothetical protein